MLIDESAQYVATRYSSYEQYISEYNAHVLAEEEVAIINNREEEFEEIYKYEGAEKVKPKEKL